jgi:hypothetical protein
LMTFKKSRRERKMEYEEMLEIEVLKRNRNYPKLQVRGRPVTNHSGIRGRGKHLLVSDNFKEMTKKE